MFFNIKRYYHGVKQRQIWLLLILILPMIYFIFSAITPDRFTISQDINISANLPVIVSNPLDIRQVKDLIASPETLTHNSFSLKKLMSVLSDSESSAVSVATLSMLMENQGKMLKETVKKGISISEAGESSVKVKYYGKDLKLGEILVYFYSDRLIQKTLEGIRAGNHNFPRAPLPELSGQLVIDEESSVWRSDRNFSMVLIFIISIVCIMFLIGVFEWNDNSFKSERQIGRYLNTPVLGSIPDLNRMSKLMKANS
jgi:hypothetical protein